MANAQPQRVPLYRRRGQIYNQETSYRAPPIEYESSQKVEVDTMVGCSNLPISRIDSTDSAICMEQRSPQKKSIGLYTLDATIGIGTYGSVKKAYHRVVNREVAIKIIKKRNLDRDGLQKVYREIEVQKRLHHPYVLELIQVMETDSKIYIVTEMCSGGELYNLLKLKRWLPEEDVRRYMYQLAEAIKYCHMRGVVHRDIKAENLLIDEFNNIKLADFGFSNFFTDADLMNSYCGSPQYAAPEVFEGVQYHGPAIDVWSMGVILHILLTGKAPFEGESFVKIRDQVLHRPLVYPYFVSPDAVNLLNAMLCRDASKRATINQVLNHRWMRSTSVPELIKKEIAVYNCLERSAPTARIISCIGSLEVNEDTVHQCVREARYDNIFGIYRLLVKQWKHRKLVEVARKEVSSDTLLAADYILNHGTKLATATRIDSEPLVEKIANQMMLLDMEPGPHTPLSLNLHPGPEEYPYDEFNAAMKEEKIESYEKRQSMDRNDNDSQPSCSTIVAQEQDKDESAIIPEPRSQSANPFISFDGSEGYGGTASTSAFSTVPGSCSSMNEQHLRRLPSDISRRINDLNIIGKRRSITESSDESDCSVTALLPKRPSLPEYLGKVTEDGKVISSPILTTSTLSGSRDKKSILKAMQMKRHARKAAIERASRLEKRTMNCDQSRASFYLPPPSLPEGGSFDDTDEITPPNQNNGPDI